MNKSICFLISTAFAFSTASAQLMLDFGPTIPIGTDLYNSPAHASGAISVSDTTWNILGKADVSSGLLFADGTAATGVSVNLGTETFAGSDVISFTTNPGKSSALGTGFNGIDGGAGWFSEGIFADQSVGTDGIWGPDNAANGLRIDGLVAGAYEIFFVGSNTNSNVGGAIMNLYSGVGASSNSFDFSSLMATSSTITNNTFWSEGENYARATITLSEGQSLFLANDTTGLDNDRGFINSVQINAIPEPSSFGLLAGILGAICLVRRRRA
ncbi:PEP-CTERM sorting domain-containing protein [Puniceicoccus vermicola]|uniref:PEP-CTERM sorting domain-containing protein n=1 Tax=Puniceicoccus vermicola TaxID=388746 RepID=A0A7X1E4X7_9BACT|nr:PEP-CTERM sorting domain-containing protein [Puniceicoccus vermicola]MBC2602586.1 PEP-CTERM sorting domain-containing protein [Puniceicoccus vermicola]